MRGAGILSVVHRGVLAVVAVVGLAFGFGSVSPTLAQSTIIAGSCEGFDLSPHVQSADNPLGKGLNVIALYDGVPTFSNSSGSIAAGQLNLGDLVTIKEDGNLVGVTRIGSGDDSAVEYVRRTDLSCTTSPLISDLTHLERKAVIRTETAVSTATEKKAVAAYRTPQLNDCAEDCRKLSRFDLYFVIAETANALLLSREVRIATTENSPMVGWIAKGDVYEWPYSVGLRVAEDFMLGDGPGAICGYLTLEDARANDESKCQPILGGPSWFETSTRMLVMQQHPVDASGTIASASDVIFETVAPLSLRNEATMSGGGGVNPATLGDTDVDVLLRNNRIDLFFLIDGTRSMQPYIDSIRGTAGNDGLIQSMLKNFQGELSSGVIFRAGFRVFRDTNGPDRNSIGEGLSLPEENCQDMTAVDSTTNLSLFNTEIAKVQVTSESGDDYSEDLYGGLEQALRDLRGCSDNRKLVFIITDAGYDAAEQASRGVDIPDLDRMMTRFNDEFDAGAMFFLRPAFNTAQQSQDYAEAYEDLATEAQTILNKVAVVQGGSNIDDFFIRLAGGTNDAASIVDRISQSVIEPNVQPEVINEIIIDIRGGASLQQAIERLRAERRDIPGYFWQTVEQGACIDLGDACSQATFQSVREVYVRNSEHVALDVWMDDEQLEMWTDLLKQITDVAYGNAERRRAMVSAIDEAVRSIIREPEFNNSQESIGDYLARAGYLPTGFKTPLLGYSLGDLMSENKVSECEIIGLGAWLEASRSMLRIVASGDTLPDVARSPNPPSCGDLSDAGTRIRNPTATIGERSISPGAIRSTSTENTLAKPMFWIPQIYLP